MIEFIAEWAASTFIDWARSSLVWANMAAVCFYAPSIIAALRSHRNFWGIFVFNTFLGWMWIGWFTALAIAIFVKPKAPPKPEPDALSSSDRTPGDNRANAVESS